MSTDNELVAPEDVAETGLTHPQSIMPQPDLPDFMTKEDIEESTKGISEHIRPPRVRVVQALSKGGLTDEFNPGDTVLLPQRVLVVPVLGNEQGRPLKETFNSGAKWHFVTLFWYLEWISWNPRGVTNENAIRERTLNPTDPLVAKCRNSETWSEEHQQKDAEGKPQYIRHCEHINFIVMPIDTDIAGTPVCLSYSRAEHSVGQSLLSLIQMRKAPCYGCIFEASVGFRDNGKGEWYGVDGRNPSLDVGGLVRNPDDYDTFKAMSAEFKSAHAKGQIVVDHDDDGDTTTPSDSPAEF